MSIAFRAASAWDARGTGASQVPAIPTGTTTGDIMIMFIGCKAYNTTIGTPSGWTVVTNAGGSNGTTASGVDTGSVEWQVFYREWQSGDTGPTVTMAGSTVSLGIIYSFSRSGSGWITPVGDKGSDTSNDTSFSLTIGSDIGVTSGDMLAAFAVLAGDTDPGTGNLTTFTSPSITITGATIGAITVSNGSTVLSHDLRSASEYAACTAGTSSAAAVVAWTLNAASTGGGALIRLREVAFTTYNQTVAGTVACVASLSTVLALGKILSAVSNIVTTITSTFIEYVEVTYPKTASAISAVGGFLVRQINKILTAEA